MWMIFGGFVIHIIFFASVFDIYFKSPISYVNENYVSPLPAPAKRLVLFVADGLRAQTIFNYNSSRHSAIHQDVTVNFLRKIIDEGYPWGVAHTRVPTESRPGHVALLAGFYEDPSAIAKGWKENPVDFDSVLNQTREAWCWGSPDIVPIFSKGDGHIHKYVYSTSDTKFGSKNTTELDIWVFNKVKAFFESDSKHLKQRLEKDKIMFFLHLLGTDTAGHSYKPYSSQYKHNVHVVDKGIKEIVKIVDDYFNNDGATAYVFTSDHGMTDWGSHGSGDPTETDCPIIAWGAGVPHYLGDSRFDIKQADIAVLMSALIGVPVPMNSVGVLPAEYLNLTKHELSEAYLANAKQILAQFKIKMKATERLKYFKEYKILTEDIVEQRIYDIRRFIDMKLFDIAILECKSLIQDALDGINFYQNYYQKPMLICVTVSLILWIIVLLESVLHETIRIDTTNYKFSKKVYEKFSGRSSQVFKWIMGILICANSYFVYDYNLPQMCYIYFALPLVLMNFVYAKRSTWTICFLFLQKTNGFTLRKLLLASVFYICMIQCLVQVFFDRWFLSVLILGIGVWVYISAREVFTLNLFFGWSASCVLLMIFPLLPVIGSNTNITVLVFGGILWLLFSISVNVYDVLQRKHYRSDLSKVFAYCEFIQIGCIALGVFISVIVRERLIPDHATFLVQALSWLLSIFSIVSPLLGGNRILERLPLIIFGLATPFILLSVTYEPLFLLSLCCHLYFWLQIEYQITAVRVTKLNYLGATRHNIQKLKNQSFDQSPLEKVKSLEWFSSRNVNHISAKDFKRGFSYLFYLLFSFFGTGNIASINSFDPMWVVCFVTVFSPFLMMTLILCKTVFIFIIVTSVLRAVNIVVECSFKKLLYIILIYCDIMIINFLYLIKNEGSWLDIGMSISHFVIIEATVLFIVLLYFVVSFYSTFCVLSFRQRWKKYF